MRKWGLLWLALACPAGVASPSSVGLLQVHTEGMPPDIHPLLTHMNVRGTLVHAFKNALLRREPAMEFMDYTDLGFEAWEPAGPGRPPLEAPAQWVMKPWQGLPPGVETPWVTLVRVVLWRSFQVKRPVSLHIVLLFSTWTREGRPVLSEVVWGESQGALGAQAGRMFTVFPTTGGRPGGFPLPVAAPTDSSQAAQLLLEELILLHLRQALALERHEAPRRPGLLLEGPPQCWEAERAADWEGRWLHLRPGEEAELLSRAHPEECAREGVRCAISWYWVRSATGPSLRYRPGVDDLDDQLNLDGSARQRWSAFADHPHAYQYCAWAVAPAEP